mmetsp:Transcript_5214/g.18460  ORF Transcript_5214/g.18460 Transcript_5214/m.18460 type:complete len:337 (+) Transcript_5214:1714-2724(+)
MHRGGPRRLRTKSNGATTRRTARLPRTRTTTAHPRGRRAAVRRVVLYTLSGRPPPRHLRPSSARSRAAASRGLIEAEERFERGRRVTRGGRRGRRPLCVVGRFKGRPQRFVDGARERRHAPREHRRPARRRRGSGARRGRRDVARAVVPYSAAAAQGAGIQRLQGDAPCAARQAHGPDRRVARAEGGVAAGAPRLRRPAARVGVVVGGGGSVGRVAVGRAAVAVAGRPRGAAVAEAQRGEREEDRARGAAELGLRLVPFKPRERGADARRGGDARVALARPGAAGREPGVREDVGERGAPLRVGVEAPRKESLGPAAYVAPVVGGGVERRGLFQRL